MKNIEVVNFYPILMDKKDYFTQALIGMLQIRFKSSGLNIRGIEVYSGKKKCRFRFPWMDVVENGKQHCFPIVQFDTSENQKEFMLELKEEAKKFLKEHFKIELELKENEDTHVGIQKII